MPAIVSHNSVWDTIAGIPVVIQLQSLRQPNPYVEIRKIGHQKRSTSHTALQKHMMIVQ
jgi:hypothetical protein